MGEVGDIRSKSGSDTNCLVFDARGNGDGKVCCSIVGGHQTSISDYTAIVLVRRFSDVRIYDDGISPTLELSGGSGGGNLPMVVETHETDNTDGEEIL